MVVEIPKFIDVENEAPIAMPSCGNKKKFIRFIKVKKIIQKFELLPAKL